MEDERQRTSHFYVNQLVLFKNTVFSEIAKLVHFSTPGGLQVAKAEAGTGVDSL